MILRPRHPLASRAQTHLFYILRTVQSRPSLNNNANGVSLVVMMMMLQFSLSPAGPFHHGVVAEARETPFTPVMSCNTALSFVLSIGRHMYSILHSYGV